LSGSDGRTYTRHRNADEIQYQVAGTRLLVSANGSVELTPGTFVHIPVGVAYASITAGSSKHLTTVTTGKLTCVWEAAIESSRWSLEDIEAYREHAAAAAAAGSGNRGAQGADAGHLDAHHVAGAELGELRDRGDKRRDGEDQQVDR